MSQLLPGKPLFRSGRHRSGNGGGARADLPALYFVRRAERSEKNSRCSKCRFGQRGVIYSKPYLAGRSASEASTRRCSASRANSSLLARSVALRAIVSNPAAFVLGVLERTWRRGRIIRSVVIKTGRCRFGAQCAVARSGRDSLLICRRAPVDVEADGAAASGRAPPISPALRSATIDWGHPPGVSADSTAQLGQVRMMDAPVKLNATFWISSRSLQ